MDHLKSGRADGFLMEITCVLDGEMDFLLQDSHTLAAAGNLVHSSRQPLFSLQENCLMHQRGCSLKLGALIA